MSHEIKSVPELLTVEDISLRFKLSRGAIYQMIARREIPYFKVGRRVRFDSKEIALWIEEQRVKQNK